MYSILSIHCKRVGKYFVLILTVIDTGASKKCSIAFLINGAIISPSLS